MSADILDGILSPKAPVSTGLQKVIDFVSKNRLAYDVGGKCVVGTTCGIAHVGALKPATELMQRAMAGDKKAKKWIALFKKKADAGDPWAQKVMGLLDVPAMALKEEENIAVGKKKPDPMVVVRRVDGSTLQLKRSKANKYVKVHPGSKVLGSAATLAKLWVQRPGQPQRGQPQGDGETDEYGQPVPPQRQPPQRRPGQPPYAQPQRPVTQPQIAQAMQRVPPQNRPALMQGILAQQAQNMQQGMFGQPGYPYGYPQPQGYPQQGMYGQPQGQGIPQYYGPALSQGVPGMFAADEAFDDGTFQEEPAPGDVQFADEGADSTEEG